LLTLVVQALFHVRRQGGMIDQHRKT